MGTLRKRFAVENLSERTDLMPAPVSRTGTVAADFGDAQRASWTVRVLSDAPVVVYAVTGFADGRVVSDPQAAAEATEKGETSAAAQAGLGHDAQGIADRIERRLRDAAAGRRRPVTQSRPAPHDRSAPAAQEPALPARPSCAAASCGAWRPCRSPPRSSSCRRRHARTPRATGIQQQEWALKAIQAPDAWKTTKGKGITVAVLDTGVDADHPDLEGQRPAGQGLRPLRRQEGRPRLGQPRHRHGRDHRRPRPRRGRQATASWASRPRRRSCPSG